MDPLLAAVAALGAVAVLATGCAAMAVRVLASAARERRDDLLRIALAERASALAAEPGQIIPLAGALRRPDPPVRVPANGADAEIRGRERQAMLDAHLDPDSLEDVQVFRQMREAGFDPSDPEDARYWSEAGEH